MILGCAIDITTSEITLRTGFSITVTQTSPRGSGAFSHVAPNTPLTQQSRHLNFSEKEFVGLVLNMCAHAGKRHTVGSIALMTPFKAGFTITLFADRFDVIQKWPSRLVESVAPFQTLAPPLQSPMEYQHSRWASLGTARMPCKRHQANGHLPIH
jgi:hypothetical protein